MGVLERLLLRVCADHNGKPWLNARYCRCITQSEESFHLFGRHPGGKRIFR
jgi:hypothetical protein